MKKTLYLFVDTETTGLNYEDGNSVPRDNKMLQIAFKLYDHTITKELVAKNYQQNCKKTPPVKYGWS